MSTVAAMRCPVCRSPIGEQVRCPHCAWILSAGPWLAPDDCARRRFEDEFNTATRFYDLAAVARVGEHVDCGIARFAPLLHLIRGGEASADDIELARRTTARHPTQPAGQAVGHALQWLSAGPAGARTLTVIEIGADEVGVLELRSDHLGALHPLGLVRRIEWRTLLSYCPPDPDEVLFLLAGGIGEHYPDRLGLDEAQCRDRLRGLAAPGVDTDLVVLHRVPGWPWPDRLAAGFASVHPVHGPRLGGEFLSEAARYAPLRVGHGLVAVRIDGSGATHPTVRPLFRPGATAAAASTVAVNIEIPTTADELVLAIVAAATPMRSAPLAVFRCPVPDGPSATIEFTLDAPGFVSPGHGRNARYDEAGSTEWPELLDDMPPSYRPPDDALDLVLAVELGGDAEAFGRRRETLTQLVDRIRDRHPDPDGVRVAVLGYRDHTGTRPQQVLRGAEFGALDAVPGTIEKLTAAPVIEPAAAPVEDVLAAAVELAWRGPPVTRRLLLIGSRPPHPARPHNVAGCNNGYDWRGLLAKLHQRGVEHLAIWDRAAWAWNAVDSPLTAATTRQWRSLSHPFRTLELGPGVANFAASRAQLLGQTERAAPLRFPILAQRESQENNR